MPDFTDRLGDAQIAESDPCERRHGPGGIGRRGHADRHQANPLCSDLPIDPMP